MSNIILTNDIIIVGDAQITAQSTATAFAKANVMNHANLKRRWRMNTLTKSGSNPVMFFDMGAAKTVTAIVLVDVNFDKVVIRGHASNLATNWAASAFSSGTISISKDAQTERYSVYIPLTLFDYQWLAILVPSTASAVGSYLTNWEIGKVVILDSGNAFTKNMAPGYSRGAERSYLELELASGHVERTSLGGMQWMGTLEFGARSTAEEADLTTLNNLDIADTLVFYENNSDTSKVYVCLRDEHYSGTYLASDIVTGNSIKLKERI